MKIKCILIGHYSTFSDSGYPVCDRCGAHSYNDAGIYTDENGKLLNDWNRSRYLFMPFQFIVHKIKWSRFAVWLRLTNWQKFGWHKNGLPF